MKKFIFFASKPFLLLILLCLLTANNPISANPNIPSDSDVVKILGVPSKQVLPNKKLRFLVWNLFKGGKDAFPSEFLYLAYKSDFILAQEIFLDKKMTTLLELTPQFSATTATSFFSGKEQIRTGVAILSPVRAEKISFLRSEKREPITETPKMSLINTYPIKSSTKKLTVVSIHAINFVTTQSFLFEMDKLYQELKHVPKPLVLAGDFNTWNSDRMKILEELTAKLSLKDVRFYPDNRTTFNDHPLDHFFYSEDLKVVSAKVDDWTRGSDHKPLEVVLEFKKGSSQESSDSPDSNETLSSL